MMMEWDSIQILVKEVRDYSGRKRINITNSDGLVKDDAVVVLKKSDYDDLMTELVRLQELEKNIDNQKISADTIGEKFLQPVKDSYNDIIKGLNDKIDSKDKEINRLKAIYHEYDKQVYSLGLRDILRHKNKEMSQDFNSKLWVKSGDQVVTDAEVKKVGEPDDTNSGGESQ